MQPIMENEKIQKNYNSAKEIYKSYGIDTEAAMQKLSNIPISLPCWQGDDVTGFEQGIDELSGGGIQATGGYPGKARNWQDLSSDLELALKLIPGKKRVNVHALYLNTGDLSTDRDCITPDNFVNWIEWAKQNQIGLDFNGSFFSHEKAASGLTLSHPDKNIRDFWIKHAIQSRKIAAEFGKALDTPCVINLWIPDGYKDMPADRYSPRSRLKDSLDTIFTDKYEKNLMKDAVECKLFGIGSESYVVGSHEFYLSYAIKNNMMLCLDVGHFHPTETISDKISSIFTFSDELLLHVSRGVRWDSDHVVILNDELRSITQEISRGSAWDKVNVALDFFDASINRIAAWIIGARATQKSILSSLLEPTELIKEAELKKDFTQRLALMDEFNTLPFGSVWNMYCLNQKVPAGNDWMIDIKNYEKENTLNRK